EADPMETPTRPAADAPLPGEAHRQLLTRIGVMERHVHQLRGRNRMLGWGLLASMALAGTALLRPDLLSGVLAPAPGRIEAREVVLVDETGRPRGAWTVGEDGGSSLTLMDPQHRPRLTLSVRREGDPGLSLSNQEGQRRVALGLLPDQTTSLVFADGAGVPRTVLGLVRGDAASLVLADAEGVSRIGFGLDGTGLGSVILPDEAAPGGAGGTDDGS
ncbi:MAG: hypothetical protein RQ751_12795, partial [Longimicrobiales bacterium]|nr:hypothetical protein [Longimicrobiales bacterium]